MPTEITFVKKRLEHKPSYDVPIRREGQDVDAQTPTGTLNVLLQVRAQETVVKSNNQWLEVEFLYQVVKSPGTVFPTRKGYETVVVSRAAVLADERIQISSLGFPVDVFALDFVLPAYVAYSSFIESDGLVGFGEETPLTPLHATQEDLQMTLTTERLDYR